MIKTPLNKKPASKLVLRKTFGAWSAGTPIEFIEYCDLNNADTPTQLLGRIRNQQLTIPLDLVVERRARASG